MAKKKGPSLVRIINKLDKVEQLVGKLEAENKKLAADSATVRMEKLEKELYSVMNIAMSMVAVNKEMISRISNQQQEATVTKTPTKAEQVRVGDSSTDVLGKIFAFFKKGKDDDKKQKELENDFRQERLSEARRKRKTRKPSKTATRVDRPSTNPILSLLGLIVDGVKGIFNFITGGIIGAISGGLRGLGGLLERIPVIGSVLDGSLSGLAKITDMIGSVITTITEIFAGLAGFIATIALKVITNSVGLIFRLMLPAISKLIGGVLTTVFRSIGMLTTGLSAILSNPLGMAAAAVGLGYAALKEDGLIDQENRLYFGDEVADLKKRKKYLEEVVGFGHEANDETRENAKKEIAEIDKQLPVAYDKYLNDTVIPSMQNLGYTPVNIGDITNPGGVGDIAFQRTNDKGEVEQVDYRKVDKNSLLSTTILPTSNRNFLIKSTEDRLKIESALIGEKLGRTLDTGTESLGDIIKGSMSGYSGISTQLENLKSKAGSLINNTIPTVSTTPAPSVIPQQNPPPTIPVTPPQPPSSSGTPGKVSQVINMPATVATSTSETQYEGTPAVRNPFLIATASGNHKASVVLG